MNATPDTTTTLITGGTGLVGKQLVENIEHPIIVTRSIDSTKQRFPEPHPHFVEWPSYDQPLELDSQLKIDHVVNLMGAPIAGERWTENRKKEIKDSRIVGTRNLVNHFVQNKKFPSTFVSASAIGFYGDRNDEILDENSPAGEGFLAEVCRDWEAEALPLVEHGVRVVLMRIGIVLAREGGAVKEMRKIFDWGVGGKLGTGKQWMSWIHLDDLVRLICHCLHDTEVNGVVNGVSQHPVRNVEFVKTLAAAIRRPAFLPAPRFGLRMVLGEFADTLLASQRVIPNRAIESGFEFIYPELPAAIADVVK